MSNLPTQNRLDIDVVPIAELAPLPQATEPRRRLIGRFDQLDVYL